MSRWLGVQSFGRANRCAELDLIALVNSYATVLRPRTIVVKSGALKYFSERCTAWNV